MHHSDAQVDLLIVGAGPSGLALAAELRRVGVSPMIIDSQPAAAHTSRACVVHARTLEVLDPLGVTAQLIKEGVKVPVFRIRDRDRSLATIDFAAIPSAYPFTIMCPQDRTERMLLETLERLGGAVERPSRLISLLPDASRVTATIQADGTRRNVAARWLIGCDGMHSTVREQAGIPFDGDVYEEGFILADVHMSFPLSRDEVTLFYSPRGLMVVAPLPDDHYRIVATDDAAPEHPSQEYVQSLLDGRGPQAEPARIRDVVWSSRFKIHHRVARTPRKGRILLCGDAAHVHSPAGGQGMNTGIQDAISLADALAKTLRDGNETRLDKWAEGRHRIAMDVVALTDRMTRMATVKSPMGQAIRNAAVAFAGHVPAARAAFARTLAELDAR